MLGNAVIALQNNQIKRHLEELISDGLLRRSRKAKLPHYELTQGGVIEMVKWVRDGDNWAHPGYFFFVHFFFTAYAPKILGLQDPTRHSPLAFKLELESLLDLCRLKSITLEDLRLKEKKLRERIDYATKSANMVNNSDLRDEELFGNINQHHPYQLNSQLPLKTLLKNLDPSHARWEIGDGTALRAEIIWKPMLALLRRYIEIIEKIA